MRDAREERGRLLARVQHQRIRPIEGPLWFVPSQKEGGYLVNVETWRCSCPDHAERCKHSIAVEILRAERPTLESPPAAVASPPAPPKAMPRGDLTIGEQANVRKALRFLRTRAGGSELLGKALRLNGGTLDHVASKQTVSASVAVRLARFAGVPVDDLLAGRYPPPGTCPHCGRGPE